MNYTSKDHTKIRIEFNDDGSFEAVEEKEIGDPLNVQSTREWADEFIERRRLEQAEIRKQTRETKEESHQPTQSQAGTARRHQSPPRPAIHRNELSTKTVENRGVLDGDGEIEGVSEGEDAVISGQTLVKTRPERRIYQRGTGSRAFRDLIISTYPILGEREDYLRLFISLITPRRVSTDEHGNEVVILHGQIVASAMGYEREYSCGNLKRYYDEDGTVIEDLTTGTFLEKFSRDVFGDAFEWREADGVAGRARTVRVDHVKSLIDPVVWAAWEKERDRPVWELEDRVWLDRGDGYNSTTLNRRRKRHDEILDGYEDQAPTDLTRRLYVLTRDTPKRTYTDLITTEGLNEARRIASELYNPHAREQQRKILDHIADDPFQRYGFSPYSPRLWGMGKNSFASLKTEIRHALLGDAVEYDFKSSQLAINSVDWNIPMLRDFLADGRDFWGEMLAHMGFPRRLKSVVKRPTYGLSYVAGRPRMIADLQDEYKALTGSTIDADRAERLFRNRFMKAILKARDAEYERVKAQLKGGGYVVDVFGRQLRKGQMVFGDGIKREVYGKNATRSIMAQVAQGTELWLMEPVIALAEKEALKDRPDFRIVCWQHDGFSVKFRSGRRKSAEKKLMAAVKAKADEHGYPTELEVKYDLDA